MTLMEAFGPMQSSERHFSSARSWLRKSRGCCSAAPYSGFNTSLFSMATLSCPDIQAASLDHEELGG